MEMTQVSTVVGGAAVSGAQTWLLDGAVGEGAQRVFRQVLYLRFTLDGQADGVRIVPGQTQLRGRFLPYEYDAKDVANSALVAQVKGVGNAVLVALDAPRQLRAVSLNNGAVLGSSSKVTVHRVDGEQVVEAATATAGWDSWLAPSALDLAGLSIQPAAQRAPGVGGPSAISNVQAQKVARALNVASLATDFTDARFGLRLSNSPTTLTTSQLSGLTVRSYPSAPRMGLAAPHTLTKPTFFLRVAGEIGKAGDMAAGQVDAGALLADALQQALDAFFDHHLADAPVTAPTLPEHLDLALWLETDAPCLFHLDEFKIGYDLVRRNFPNYAAKQVLRFAGQGVETQVVKLRIVKPAAVTQATITVAAKLGRGGVTEPSVVLSPARLAQATGIHLGLDRWVAQPLTPAQASTASGVAVGLLALAPHTQVAVEVYEDWQGQPTGKKLAATTLLLGQSGERVWQPVGFAEPLRLFVQPYWLLLKAVRGAALWLAQPSASAVQMLTQENQRWQTLSVIANTQGLVHLLSPAVASRQDAPLALNVNGVTVVAPPVITGERQTYDLTTALNTALTASDATRGDDIALTFTTGLAGVLTVYPPAVAYSFTG